MTLETLEIRFQAQVEEAAAQLQALIAQIRQVSAAASGMYSAGLRLSQGLATGIRAGKSSVIKAANEVASAAVSRIRSALQIHSPSRVAHDLGARFSQGFALGMLEGRTQAAASARSLGGVAAAAVEQAPVARVAEGDLAAAVERALGGMRVVAPIEVDGVRLGQAAIRGINAVRRATGRQMLDL